MCCFCLLNLVHVCSVSGSLFCLFPSTAAGPAAVTHACATLRPPVVVGNWAGTSSGHISVVCLGGATSLSRHLLEAVLHGMFKARSDEPAYTMQRPT